MKKTTNYQLNQWEKTDRIMMDDFNTDNAKLETALTALNRSAHFQTLFDETVAEDTNHFAVPLSSIDWSQWRTLLFEFHPAADTSSMLYICRNGMETENFALLPNTYPSRLILLPFGCGDFMVTSIFIGGGDNRHRSYPNITFSQLHSIDISRTSSSNDCLKAGSRIVLLGEMM